MRLGRSLRGWLAAAVLAAGLSPVVAESQEPLYDLLFRDVPVREALDRLVERTRISLVYDPALLAEQRVFCDARGETAEAILRCIVGESGLDYYRLSSGTYVLIAAAEGLPRSGGFSGVVVDALTRQPLGNAEIEVTGREVHATSTRSGRFLFPDLLPGLHSIRVRHLGYRPFSAQIRVPPGATLQQEILLEATPVQIEPLIVEGVERRAPLSTALVQGDGSSTGALTETGPTPMGVTRRPLTAELSIQGGSAGEHAMRLDGVPIFEPLPLAGLQGRFDPLGVDRYDVHRAGYGVSEGSFVAGVVEAQHALGGRDGGEPLTLRADPFTVSGRADGGFDGGSTSGHGMVSARRAIWDVFQPQGLADFLARLDQVDPTLMSWWLARPGIITNGATYDALARDSRMASTEVHAAGRINRGPYRSLQASGYYGRNSIGTTLSGAGRAPEDALPRLLFVSDDRYEWENVAGQLRYAWIGGARFAGEVQLYFGRHRFDRAYRMIDSDTVGYDPNTAGSVEPFLAELRSLVGAPTTTDASEVEEAGAAFKSEYALGAGHRLEGGLELARMSAVVDMSSQLRAPLIVTSAQTRAAGFLEVGLRLSRLARGSLGLRATRLLDGGSYLEPRAALTLEGGGGRLGPWIAHLSGGIYRQFSQRMELPNSGPSALAPSTAAWLPVDGSVEPPEAVHLGVDARVGPGAWTLRVSGYGKWQRRILDVDYPALLTLEATGASASSDFMGTAEGRVLGVGVRAERTLGPTRLAAGYDHTHARRTFPGRFDGEEEAVPWVEPHRWVAAAEVDVAPGLTVGGRGTSVSGQSWGLRRAYYDVLATRDVAEAPEIGRPSQDVLPRRAEIDLHLAYAARLGRRRLELRYEMRNAFDRDNVLDFALVRDPTAGDGVFGRVPRHLMGRMSMLTVRVGL